MTIFYDAATRGFYRDEDGIVPDGAVQITQEYFDELFAGQSNGKQIEPNASGYPVCVDPAISPPTYANLRAAEYPPMADYLDAVVKGDQAQIDKYIADCLAVKAMYPKPTAE